jgi:hypothetical protein
MAYTDFTPLTRVQESQDAQQIKIWDESTWNGESALTTKCNVIVYWYDNDEVLHECDPYELIDGIDTTKYDEYLSRDGHVIDITDLTEDGVSVGDRFHEGHFIIKTTYTEGSYAAGSEPYYNNHQAFLAKTWCKIRKLPIKISWPLTEEMYRINRDMFLLRMYTENAENAIDIDKKAEFRRLMVLINQIFSYYELEECF